MPEKQPLNPDVEAALRGYEVAMRDGTERDQKAALERLRQVQQQKRQLGLAATLAATEPEPRMIPEGHEPEAIAG
jgi:hypothetical protein